MVFVMRTLGESHQAKIAFSGPLLLCAIIIIIGSLFATVTFTTYLVRPHFRANLLTLLNTFTKDHTPLARKNSPRYLETLFHILVLVGLGSLLIMEQEIQQFEMQVVVMWQGLGGQETLYCDMKWWMVVLSAIIAYPFQFEFHILRISVHIMIVLGSRTFYFTVCHLVNNVKFSGRYGRMCNNEVKLNY